MQQDPIDSSQPRPVRRCRWCQQAIQSRATVCHVCGRHQNKPWQVFVDCSVLIAFIAMAATIGLWYQTRKERIASSEALRQTKVAASVMMKTIDILADGASLFGGPTEEHSAKIEEYREELKGILPPDIEAQIQEDIRQIYENNKRLRTETNQHL